MTPAQIAKLLKAARKQVEVLEQQYSAALTAVANQVVMTKKGETITLQKGKTVFKVKKNSHNRFNVYKNGKVFYSDYGWGLKQLRVDIAEGKL